MATDGTFNPSATYVEAIYKSVDPVEFPHHVIGGENPIGHETKSIRRVYGAPNADGKFISVVQNGETVYTEGHPNRLPMT